MKKTTKTIIAGTVGAAGLFLASTANASASTTVKVAKNDTVWGLAKKYNVSINSIESLNHINQNSHLILQNQSLTIPEKNAPVAKATKTSATNTSSVTVKSGDSLWAIAQKYGTTVAELQKLNGLNGNTLITPGQSLKVSGTAPAATPAPAKAATTTPQVTVSANHVTYTVKSGDSLYTIAQEYGVSVDSLRSANKLGSVLVPGQTLTVNDPTKTPAQTPAANTQTAANTNTTAATASTTTNTPAAASSSSSTTTATSSSSSAVASSSQATSTQATTSTSASSSAPATSSNTTNTTQTATSSSTPQATTQSSHTAVAATSVSTSSVISYAEQFVGVPYVIGGTSPNGFDCSGFVQYVFAHFGVNLPRTSQAQSTIGSSVSVSSAKPGDLLFWGGQGSAWHVGIYVGGSSYIAAPQPGESVAVKSFQYFQPSFAVHMN
ncbi:MAG: LysM peptidoglycan-binding domain-containing protein [Liquorilactobacillus nagelii]|uniref:C40 family peptidase n=1 Tax=Liquorilactobacillus nagelii TaxID=82688 RepID=UPI0039E9B31C